MPERQSAGNRSVPTDALLPHDIYQDVATALVWLSKAFGFREHYRYGHPESPQGAQIRLGDSWIMLERARDGRANPAQLGQATQYLTLTSTMSISTTSGRVRRAPASWRRPTRRSTASGSMWPRTPRVITGSFPSTSGTSVQTNGEPSS